MTPNQSEPGCIQTNSDWIGNRFRNSSNWLWMNSYLKLSLGKKTSFIPANLLNSNQWKFAKKTVFHWKSVTVLQAISSSGISLIQILRENKTEDFEPHWIRNSFPKIFDSFRYFFVHKILDTLICEKGGGMGFGGRWWYLWWDSLAEEERNIKRKKNIEKEKNQGGRMEEDKVRWFVYRRLADFNQPPIWRRDPME